LNGGTSLSCSEVPVRKVPPERPAALSILNDRASIASRAAVPSTRRITVPVCFAAFRPRARPDSNRVRASFSLALFRRQATTAIAPTMPHDSAVSLRVAMPAPCSKLRFRSRHR